MTGRPPVVFIACLTLALPTTGSYESTGIYKTQGCQKHVRREDEQCHGSTTMSVMIFTIRKCPTVNSRAVINRDLPHVGQPTNIYDERTAPSGVLSRAARPRLKSCARLRREWCNFAFERNLVSFKARQISRHYDANIYRLALHDLQRHHFILAFLRCHDTYIMAYCAVISDTITTPYTSEIRCWGSAWQPCGAWCNMALPLVDVQQ